MTKYNHAFDYVDFPSGEVKEELDKICMQVAEEYDSFIFTSILPWCSETYQQIITKRELTEALNEHLHKYKAKECMYALEKEIAECKKLGLFERCEGLMFAMEILKRVFNIKEV